jgi:heme-degrading monooxygenase HmoA
MYARSTTFKDRPQVVDQGIAMVRDEVMPAVQAMDGCVGLSMLVDRVSGSCVVTSAWETEEALRASAPLVAPARDRAQRLFGSRPEVRTWEIGVLHRRSGVADGACARVTWTRVLPEQMDEHRELFGGHLLPQVEQLPGFESASMLMDRRTGHVAIAVVYESAEALAHNREAAMALRTEALRRLPTELLDVAEFEVALAHLRVPETV